MVARRIASPKDRVRIPVGALVNLEAEEKMPYDFDGVPDREPPRLKIQPLQGNDLEAIVTLLELAAIYLTPVPGKEFTWDALFSQVRTIGGDEITIDERDALIVVGYVKFLKKVSGNRFCLK